MENNKDNINDLMYSLNKTLKRLSFWVSVLVWFNTIGKLLSKIVGSFIATIWAGLLIAYAYTGNQFYLNVFFGIIGGMFILYSQFYWIEELINYRKRKKYTLFDMTKMNEPDKNDVNNAFFPNVTPKKYKVIDKNDKKCYDKQYFLYPVLARLNPDGTVSFFKDTQLEEIKNTNDGSENTH